MTSQSALLALLGRVLLVLLFLAAGYNKLTHFDATVAYITKAGMPAPTLAAAGAVVVELGCALLLLVGWQARIMAWIMAAFTLVAAIYFHAFWAAAPEAYMGQFNNFFKNVAICGGLLFVAAFGPGAYSIDARRRLP